MELSHGWSIVIVDGSNAIDQAPGQAQIEPNALEVRSLPFTLSQSVRETIGEKSEVWFQKELEASDLSPGSVLFFEGLSSPCHVYFGKELLLKVENSFLQHAVSLPAIPATGRQTLTLCFQPLALELKKKKTRPRWKTRLVSHQNLRWQRTHLLGHIPGWSATHEILGPFGKVHLLSKREALLKSVSLNSHYIKANPHIATKARGEVLLAITVPEAQIDELKQCQARMRVGNQETSLRFVQHCFEDDMQKDKPVTLLTGSCVIEDPELWWPHTHGKQPSYEVSVTFSSIQDHPNLKSDEWNFTQSLGKVSFRKITVNNDQGAFQLSVNDCQVFCRGACWTPTHLTNLSKFSNHNPTEIKETLLLCKEAGMNMLRIGGTMAYECKEFYELCDELGILVWQDFMFANMDYPFHDRLFLESVIAEATDFLRRTSQYSCLAVFCGGSEVQQQAAMMGVPRSEWTHAFYDKDLPGLCKQFRPDAIYVPSSPTGGALPFQVNVGISHYYGVGAYLRPLEDARRSRVRFAAECLAFANVPEEETCDKLLNSGQSPYHSPIWKAAVPRDNGTGWDFDDVRDHYFELLFGEKPSEVRYANMPRYLQASRVVSAEVMQITLSEWRRKQSTCSGALIWFLKDFEAGAGWGLLDAYGKAKAAYYGVKRALQPVSAFLTDEGLNGLEIHLVNEEACAREAELTLSFYQRGQIQIAHAEKTLLLPARSAQSFFAQALFPNFIDMTYAYRFGPLQFDVACLSLKAPQLSEVNGSSFASHEESTFFYFPKGYKFECRSDLDISATVEQLDSKVGSEFERELGSNTWLVTLTARAFCQSVSFELAHFTPSDNYFHLAPGQIKKVLLRSHDVLAKPRGYVHALNGTQGYKLQVNTK